MCRLLYYLIWRVIVGFPDWCLGQSFRQTIVGCLADLEQTLLSWLGPIKESLSSELRLDVNVCRLTQLSYTSLYSLTTHWQQLTTSSCALWALPRQKVVSVQSNRRIPMSCVHGHKLLCLSTSTVAASTSTFAASTLTAASTSTAAATMSPAGHETVPLTNADSSQQPPAKRARKCNTPGHKIILPPSPLIL